MAKDPTTVAQKWATNLAASTPSIQAGVQAVTKAPGAAAAAQQAVWLANVQASAAKWARNVAAVTLPQWQDAMTTKGIPRIGPGATAAQPKFAAFMTSLLPFIDNAKASLPPRGTFDQNVQRMVAFATAMRGYVKPPGV